MTYKMTVSQVPFNLSPPWMNHQKLAHQQHIHQQPVEVGSFEKGHVTCREWVINAVNLEKLRAKFWKSLNLRVFSGEKKIPPTKSPFGRQNGGFGISKKMAVWIVNDRWSNDLIDLGQALLPTRRVTKETYVQPTRDFPDTGTVNSWIKDKWVYLNLGDVSQMFWTYPWKWFH